jgi:hypothetical protein
MKIIKPIAKTVVLTSFFSTHEGIGSSNPMSLEKLETFTKVAGINSLYIEGDNLNAL